MTCQSRMRNCHLQEGVMESQFSCVLLVGSKQLYHFTFAWCRVCLTMVMDIEKLKKKKKSTALQSCWRTLILCRQPYRGAAPGRLSFEYDVWGLLGTSETGSTKADTKVAKRKGWEEGIQPKPPWNFTLCSGPDSQQGISERLAPRQGRNFWYKKKKEEEILLIPSPPPPNMHAVIIKALKLDVTASLVFNGH